MHRPSTLVALLASLALPLGCPTNQSDDDDFATDDDDTSDDDDDTSDDDDATGDDDDATGDDDDAASCWQAETILDVSAAAGAGAGYPAPELAASCDGDELVVTGNGIPTYTFVAMTPNALVEVDQNYRITTNPIIANQPTDIPLLGLAGFAVNGMPWFGPNEGAFPDPYGDPVYNGIMDGCMGHTAFEYHNHALAQKCLTQAAVTVAEPWTLADPDASQASPILGWALDGHPIYGPYGCTDAACETVIEMESSWVQTGDPTTYAWDNHEYQEQAGDQYLDRCNGRTQPDGSYGYHATATFPYILGCYTGTPNNNTGDEGGEEGGGDDGDGGPEACEDETDCIGACPDEALGCTCADGPQGGGICVPTCVEDSDCEDLVGGPPQGLTCNEAAGVCVPVGGGGPQ